MGKNEIREKIKRSEALGREAAKSKAQTEILRTEKHGYIEVDSDEKTCELAQEKIRENVSLRTAEQAFSLDFEDGPIYAKHCRSGRHMLLRNERGYMASFDIRSMSLMFEIDVRDKIKDALYLHSEKFIAVAQEKNVFIYNGVGSEVHCVRKNNNVFKLEYLPYHYLLATASSDGFLKYQDTSTGVLVSTVFIRDKNITAMRQNPWNAIIHTGARNGIVSLWSPNAQENLMKVHCHKSAVSSIEIDRTGGLMVTAGLDNKINVWDLRNTYSQLNTLRSSFTVQVSALSQRNMLAIANGGRVHIWKDFTQDEEPLYLTHKVRGGTIASLDFCNYEDILCIGHSRGVSNLIIPGAGDPVYDSYEDSPFITKGWKRELEIRKLLEKIPYDLIGMESQVGSVYKEPRLDQPQASRPRYYEAVPERRDALSRFYRKEYC
jgi:U3 small nucleolar RNA-associated protein 7